MPETLPGMPPRAGDPGVFVCGPDDIEPWRKDVSRSLSVAPQQVPARRAVWLVLTTCDHCNHRTGRYCSSHDLKWLDRGDRKRAGAQPLTGDLPTR